ncbi:MAG TPA: thiamine pyrophosphate-binding protein [Planctomycetaceae bacterium]|nr:thiamine pyrophosphate-binding protein [Planctomycetaceae bacterium]
MFTGRQIVAELTQMGISHVVWLPDSTLGEWEQALSTSSRLKLVRVCREGEAWAVAAGLHLGGATPLVMIQCTGLFESGDSLRNALYDYGLPLFALVGYRSYLNPSATDSARTFTEPNLKSWNIDYRLIDSPEKLPELAMHYAACRQAGRAGVVLVGEGRM